MRLLLATIVLLAALLPPTDRLAAQTVAVMRLDAPSVPFHTVGQLSRAVSAGVSLAGFEVEEAAGSSTLNDVMLLIGCSTITPECLTELAESFEAPLLVYGTVRTAQDGVELQLTSFDARVPRMLFSVAIPVAAGAESELVEVTASLMAGLGVARVSAPGIEGAALVDEDGTEHPLPLWVTDLSNAPQRYTVRGTSGRSTTLTLSAAGPTVEIVEVAPRGRGARPPRDRRGPSGWTIAGWSTMGAGLAVGAVSGLLGARTLSLQEDFDAELRQRQARELADQGHRSARATNITIGVAAALVAGGTTALILGRRPERRAEALVPRWVADSAGVGVQF